MDASSLLRKWQTWAVAGVVLIAILPDDSENAGDTTSVTSVVTESPQAPVSVPADEPDPPEPTPDRVATALLFITDQKDGDSFVASDGNEYRLGLVNTAEASEPCGPAAARFTREFLADGFTADAYSRDTYGRHVAEVFDRSGRSLNVALATSGYGNDRYLNQFRHENPDLARRLEAAFATAATPSCANVAPAPFARQPEPVENAGANCMSGYDPCLPIRGDMNCPEVNGPVRVTGSDPYGLDRDGDGIGCD
jgi:endonuclease YncB( thermonuclease family)